VQDVSNPPAKCKREMTDFSSPSSGGDPRQPNYLPPAVRNPQLPTPAQDVEYRGSQRKPGSVPPAEDGAGLGRVIPPSLEQDVHWTEALQDAPPWLGSMVVHMLVLIIMGLMVVTLKHREDVPIQATIYGDSDKPGEQ
jgi:hypothetical protein